MYEVRIAVGTVYGFSYCEKVIETRKCDNKAIALAQFENAKERVIRRGFEDIHVELWDPDETLMRFFEF